MKALILGATGATGTDLIHELLKDEAIESVHAFSRRPVGFTHPKLQESLVDFDAPETWSSSLEGDVAFCCLGTTLKAAGGKLAQRKVDYQYQLDFAKGCKDSNVPSFVLVSSYGANKDSKIFYTKMKGELEQAVRMLHFEKLTVFQPGMLVRKKSDRVGEVWGAKLMNFASRLNGLQHLKPLKTEILAKAMLNSSKIKSSGESFIKLGAIFNFAQKSEH